MTFRYTIGVVAAAIFTVLLVHSAQRYMAGPRVQVTDVRQSETIVLSKTPDSGHVHGIIIQGSGLLDGEATITLVGAGYDRVEKLQGPVRFSWGGDWYDGTATIRYEPVNVQSGQLVLHYRFHTLK